ncbi:flagellar biosynthetic protein FliO [Neobacillus sp. K501]
MKRFVLLMGILLYLFSLQPTIYAAGTYAAGDPSVYDAIHDDEKDTPSETKAEDSQSTSLFPLFMKFIGSFILVIALLLFILRFLTKRKRLLSANGPIVSLGGQVIGNNRSIQIVLIGQTIYILGVGDTVNLIRTISQGEEYQHLLDSYENQAEPISPKWIPKDLNANWNSIFRKHMQKMHKENGEE